MTKGKRQKPNILIASGVNLDLLGRREPEIYGTVTLKDIERQLTQLFSAAADLTFFQTNSEAEFLAKLDHGWDGAVLNPGAWTHTSVALRDRVVGLGLSCVEVHLSNIAAREEFRKTSFLSPVSLGTVSGFGAKSYELGVEGLLHHLKFRGLGK